MLQKNSLQIYMRYHLSMKNLIKLTMANLCLILILIHPAYGSTDTECENFSLFKEYGYTWLISTGESLKLSFDLLIPDLQDIEKAKTYYERNFVGAYQYNSLNDPKYMKRLNQCLENRWTTPSGFVKVMSTVDFLGKVPAAVFQGAMFIAPAKLVKFIYAKNKIAGLSLIIASTAYGYFNFQKMMEEQHRIQAEQAENIINEQFASAEEKTLKVLNYTIDGYKSLETQLNEILEVETDPEMRSQVLSDLKTIEEEIQKNIDMKKLILEAS